MEDGEADTGGLSESGNKRQEGDETEAIEVTRSSPVKDYIDFLGVFCRSKGGPHLVLLILVVSAALGSVAGLVPDIMGDRYARLNHRWDGPECSSFDAANKPRACKMGSDDSQSAAALSEFVKNMLTLFFNTAIAGWSDVKGRKMVFVFGLFLIALSPISLLATEVIPTMSPVWFYSCQASSGVVGWMAIAFAMLSDVMPPDYRAASFGVFLGFFYFGYCLGPSQLLVMTHFQVSMLSSSLAVLVLLCAICFMPETLPAEIGEQNRQSQEGTLLSKVLQPVISVAILNRNAFFRLLSLGSFMSGMVYSADLTFVLYYIENQLNVRDADLARMFAMMGLAGIVIQAFFMQYLVKFFGEKGFLVISFIAGTCHNLFYGIARSKVLIYVALVVAQVTKVNFTLTSSIASTHVNRFEQGRIQGAIFAVSAVANAVGPVLLQLVYDYTKESFGPGTMFIFASFLYFIGTIFVSLLPNENPPETINEEDMLNEQNLDEPLLPDN